MTEVTRIEKYNKKIEAWHTEEFYTDVKPLYANRVVTTVAGDIPLGSYTPDSGNYAVITAMKYAAESAAWFSFGFGGAVSDFGYLPAKGLDVIAGSPTDPYVALDHGETITGTALSAGANLAYAWIIYGFERPKEPVK